MPRRSVLWSNLFKFLVSIAQAKFYSLLMFEMFSNTVSIAIHWLLDRVECERAFVPCLLLLS